MTPIRHSAVEQAAPRSPLDEPSVIRRVASGDRAAFEVLMRRYNRRLYRLARASLRDDTEAKDALQDAYLCAYRSIGQFRGEAALLTWLSRLVLNECNARLRRSIRRENIVSIVSADRHMDVCSEVAEPGQSRSISRRAHSCAPCWRERSMSCRRSSAWCLCCDPSKNSASKKWQKRSPFPPKLCAAAIFVPRACCTRRSPGKSIWPRVASSSLAASTVIKWSLTCSRPSTAGAALPGRYRPVRARRARVTLVAHSADVPRRPAVNSHSTN